MTKTIRMLRYPVPSRHECPNKCGFKCRSKETLRNHLIICNIWRKNR